MIMFDDIIFYGFAYRDYVKDLDMDEILENLKIYDKKIISVYMGEDGEIPYAMAVAANKHLTEKQVDNILDYVIKHDLLYETSLMKVNY